MCVLLVEDESLVRLVVADALIDEGFDVLEARDGLEATRLMEEHARRISVLVTDFHMPGDIDGLEVARRFRTFCPGVPIIVATARPDALRRTPGPRHNYELIRKPFTISELVDKIDKTVAR